jgi:hypothetical protein
MYIPHHAIFSTHRTYQRLSRPWSQHELDVISWQGTSKWLASLYSLGHVLDAYRPCALHAQDPFSLLSMCAQRGNAAAAPMKACMCFAPPRGSCGAEPTCTVPSGMTSFVSVKVTAAVAGAPCQNAYVAMLAYCTKWMWRCGREITHHSR